MDKINKKTRDFELFKEIDNFFNGVFDSNKNESHLIKSTISHKFINKKNKRKKNGKNNWN